MRMWMIDPQLMCNKHLLGEHVETHMLEGSLKKGRSLAGFINNGLVDLERLGERHDQLAEEMKDRGMNHKSPINRRVSWTGGSVDEQASLAELQARCPDCRSRIDEAITACSHAIGEES